MQSDLKRFGCIALLGALACFALSAEDLPPWLKGLPSVSVPSYPAKVNSVVLFNEESTTALDSGRLSTITRTAIKMLNRQGGDVLFYDEYDSNSGKVRDFRAWMISPSGKVKKFDKSEIVDVACVDNDVYNECRRRAVSGKNDAEAGAVFAYESVIEYESFSNQIRFRFQDSTPVLHSKLTVSLPQGWEVRSRSFNGAPSEASRSGSSYSWQMENLAQLEPETASPSVLSLVPWVGVSLTPLAGRKPPASWQEAAKQLAELNVGQFEPSDALTVKARSLVEGAKTEMDKIRAIGRFAQQVNYVSIQINLAKGGGYRPHTASEIFQKLYGDCKDKANLTRAMLKAVGITAYPVAIFAGDRTHVTEEWPSLGAFNHAISAIRVGPDTQAPAVLEHAAMGRLLFFDPTDPYVPPGYLPEHEQASLALIGAEESGDLVRAPAGVVQSAARDRLVEAVLNSDGSLTGKFTERRTGEERASAVSSYRSTTKPEYSKWIERWVGSSIPGASITNVDVQDNDGDFVLKAQFAAQRFGQRPQQRMIVFKAALLTHGDLRLTEKTRKYPVVLNADALSETVRIQIPTGLKIDELPDAIKIDSPFGKYEATWKSELGAVIFTRALQMPPQTVPVAQYAQLRKFLDVVTSSEEAAVVLIQ
jgi:hypothetical protein